MKFAEVVGHASLKKQLISTVKENRISHAQLFAGSEGSGGFALALAYAQYICCENKKESDSCGICKSCVKYEKLIHPDLHFVYPVVNTSSNPKAVSDDYITEWRKAVLTTPYLNLNNWIEIIASDNKQGGIFERESGEIIRKLNLKTYEAEYKIMIIWMPEKMNIVASNKLLKMIEEPPLKTIFLMISENPGSLIATILSRCQYVKIPPLQADDIRNALNGKIEDKDRLEEIVRVSAGNYLRTIDLIEEHDDNKINFDLFVSVMRSCYSRKVIDLIRWSEEVASMGREKQKKFLTTSLRLVRENFALNLSNNSSFVYLNDMETSFSEKFHPYINESNIFQISEELNKAIYHIEANGNAKIIFLDLALKLVKLIKQ